MSRRRCRRAESGFTLIETITTVTLVAVALVFIIGSFAQAQRIAGITQTQATMQVLMRQTTDTIRDRTGYTYCATTGSYASSLPAQLPSGITGIAITAVTWTQTSSAGVAHSCGGGTDYGVQRITLRISYAGGSLTRTVFKGVA